MSLPFVLDLHTRKPDLLHMLLNDTAYICTFCMRDFAYCYPSVSLTPIFTVTRRSYRLALVRHALFGPDSWRFAAMLGVYWLPICLMKGCLLRSHNRHLCWTIQVHSKLPSPHTPKTRTTTTRPSSLTLTLQVPPTT